MSAKDKKYRKMKKQLESAQKEVDSCSIILFRELYGLMIDLSLRKYSIGSYHDRKYIEEHGPKINPEDYINRDKKKKYRTPTRRLR